MSAAAFVAGWVIALAMGLTLGAVLGWSTRGCWERVAIGRAQFEAYQIGQFDGRDLARHDRERGRVRQALAPTRAEREATTPPPAPAGPK